MTAPARSISATLRDLRRGAGAATPGARGAGPSITRRSTRTVRITAALPRAIALTLIAVLALSGAVNAVRGRPAVRAPAAPAPAHDLAAEAFATSFVRAYLGWDSGTPDAYAQAIGAFMPESVLTDGPPVSPARGGQRVLATDVVSDVRTGATHRTVVVAARTTSGSDYVAVPVSSDGNGMFVSGYPALVGAPAVDGNASPPAETQIDDAELETVVRRAIANYVSGQASNLRADLTPDAVVSLPSQQLSVRSVERVTWAAPGVAAVELAAAATDGTTWTLRYELRVVKRDRWYVAAVDGDPGTKEDGS